jgi:DNA-binding transcriptional LysR family regulator
METWIGPNPDVADRLRCGRADVAIMEWWDDRPGFEKYLWRWEPLVVIVSPSHPWASRQTIGINDLLREPLLGGEGGTGTGQLLKTALGKRNAGIWPIAPQA